MKINTNPCPVQLEIARDIPTFLKRYKKLKGFEPDMTDTLGLTTYAGNSVLIGAFNDDILTLTHALNHFCLWTFDYIGMPVNSNNSEAYCYYYDRILKQILPSYLAAYK